MLKLSLRRRFPFVDLFDEGARRQIARLEEECKDLRERLIEAQEVKNQSLRQLEEVRKEKERLRGRVATHKQENENLSKVNDRLKERISSLQTEIDELKSKRKT